jgi:hypothetical protein
METTMPSLCHPLIVFSLIHKALVGDAMAVAAAASLHPKLSAIDAKLSSAAAEPSAERPTILVEFVVPGAAHSPDQE